MRRRVKIIGLTGPIAAGKSTVARLLKKQGALVIDVDKLAHQLYPLVRGKLIRAFGKQVLARNGKINRQKLGVLVFSSRRKLAQLSKIIHPVLIRKIKSEIKKLQSEQGIIIINAALPQLFRGLADEIWVVDADEKARLQRKPAIRKIMKFQMQPKQYLTLADKIIKNNGDKKQLNAKIQALF